MAVIFVTGPVRSGKSAFAVDLARRCGREVTYVATAEAAIEDAEWRVRLTRHLRDRPAEWKTIETAMMPHESQLALFRDAPETSCLLVDALGTWMASRIAMR
ncbi:MAG: bifunctional adenosylcobinamide kinase/adenosylcobinamide-phosphate guanylyltransferase, partial [Candidatus Eremiobacteraeota bacterium]|nr:bifunctional adenosylcobinamide kinase/adenosylcobinamide-phosphate guanylyltransferase [Candidatus Eremiobacteraeota bacterium]